MWWGSVQTTKIAQLDFVVLEFQTNTRKCVGVSSHSENEIHLQHDSEEWVDI
jgi:hypothetical protein